MHLLKLISSKRKQIPLRPFLWSCTYHYETMKHPFVPPVYFFKTDAVLEWLCIGLLAPLLATFEIASPMRPPSPYSSPKPFSSRNDKRGEGEGRHRPEVEHLSLPLECRRNFSLCKRKLGTNTVLQHSLPLVHTADSRFCRCVDSR